MKKGFVFIFVGLTVFLIIMNIGFYEDGRKFIKEESYAWNEKEIYVSDHLIGKNAFQEIKELNGADIDVNKEELMIRLTGRRVCKKCGASYHVVNIPPKKEGICDVCGAELEQRKDDNEETAANRIEVYNKETKPLIDYYEKAGNIAHLDGTIGLENVFNAIVDILGE